MMAWRKDRTAVSCLCILPFTTTCPSPDSSLIVQAGDCMASPLRYRYRRIRSSLHDSSLYSGRGSSIPSIHIIHPHAPIDTCTCVPTSYRRNTGGHYTCFLVSTSASASSAFYLAPSSPLVYSPCTRLLSVINHLVFQISRPGRLSSLSVPNNHILILHIWCGTGHAAARCRTPLAAQTNTQILTVPNPQVVDMRTADLNPAPNGVFLHTTSIPILTVILLSALPLRPAISLQILTARPLR